MKQQSTQINPIQDRDEIIATLQKQVAELQSKLPANTSEREQKEAVLSTPMKFLSLKEVARELKKTGHVGFPPRLLYQLRDEGLPMFNGKTTPENVLTFVESKMKGNL